MKHALTKWLVLAGFALTSGCPPSTVSLDLNAPGVATDVRAISAALDIWEETFVTRKDFAILTTHGLVKNAKGKTLMGRAICLPHYTEITIFVDAVPRANYFNGVVWTTLHEMAHVHLSCKNTDHMEGTVLAKSGPGEPRIDCASFEKLVAYGNTPKPGVDLCAP